MTPQKTKIIMDACEQQFGYTPKTVAEFAAFINFQKTYKDDNS